MVTAEQPYSQAYLNEYIGNRLGATAISFIVINTVFVGIRLLAQYLRPTRFWWDDFWIVLSWMCVIIELSVELLAVYKQAIGYHIVAITPERMLVYGIYLGYVAPCLYNVASTLPKYSILALYLRVFHISGSGLITCVLRMVTVFKFTVVSKPNGVKVADLTWDNTLTHIYLIVEPSVYLISACLLSSRSLLHYVFDEKHLFIRIKRRVLSLKKPKNRARIRQESPDEEPSKLEKGDHRYVDGSTSQDGKNSLTTVDTGERNDAQGLPLASSQLS
ncbi:MAG: hypothetical protein Q9162_004675 [Coniocarpon cinnabarinum]